MIFSYAIFGSRNVDLHQVRAFVFNYVASSALLHDTVVSGGASGVDTEARRAAQFYRRPYREFPADWKKHGRKAGFRRNHDIERSSDWGLAVWNGESRGTLHTRSLFHQARKPVHTFVVDKHLPRPPHSAYASRPPRGA